VKEAELRQRGRSPREQSICVPCESNSISEKAGAGGESGGLVWVLWQCSGCVVRDHGVSWRGGRGGSVWGLNPFLVRVESCLFSCVAYLLGGGVF